MCAVFSPVGDAVGRFPLQKDQHYAQGRELRFFQVGEDFNGAVQDAGGDSGQTRDMDAVAFISTAGNQFVDKDDLVVPLADADIEVMNTGQPLGQLGQFVVVRGKESFGTALIMQILGDAPGQAQSVKGTGAAADFIKDDEAPLGGAVENGRCFAHLDHAGGLHARDIVAGADAGKDSVYDVDSGWRAGIKGAVWAIRQRRALWRIKVLLPAMLGPVMMAICF